MKAAISAALNHADNVKRCHIYVSSASMGHYYFSKRLFGSERMRYCYFC